MNDAPLPESEFEARRERLAERMEQDGIDPRRRISSTSPVSNAICRASGRAPTRTAG